ncbi:MAG: hypothetical protein HAW64_03015 [Alphaproteobacteria bacterium]|nr:hypothetical protein [Alphaproteobacteria bacterium]
MTDLDTIDQKSIASYNLDLDDNDFNKNYNFIIGQNDAGEFFAHRPIAPAFFIFRDTEKQAATSAKDIIADYIRLFVLDSKKIETRTRVIATGARPTQSYTVDFKNLNAA